MMQCGRAVNGVSENYAFFAISGLWLPWVLIVDTVALGL